jgi:hypothetical protein
MNSLSSFVFHNATATAPNNGETYINTRGTTMNLYFTATSTFTANLEGKNSGGSTWFPLIGVNISDANLTMSTTVSNASYIYQVDISGIDNVRVRLSANAGSVSCLGRVVG